MNVIGQIQTYHIGIFHCGKLRQSESEGILDRRIYGRRVRDAMELFQVADLVDASPYQLSGGQKKRVALAAVVSMNPDILVLDEPTNGLDEDSCDIVVNFLLAYVAAGKTVLMSTHHQDLVRRLEARAIYIDRYHHVVEAPVPSYGTESGAAE